MNRNAADGPRFVPLTRELLDWAVLEEADDLTAEAVSHNMFAERALAVPHLAMAMLSGGRVMVAGGLVMHWTGRAEAWWLRSRHATRRDLVAATRYSAQWLDLRQRDPALRRVEMYCRADAAWHRSFATALGFRIEGHLHAWDPMGRDHVLFARVRPA